MTACVIDKGKVNGKIMKVTMSWLKEYTEVMDTADGIAEKLTMAGLEVDAVTDRYDHLNGVVVSRVVSVEKHPQADKLHCCKVDVGEDGLLSIVCGAPNVREGLVVPCATIGTVLPGEFVIKKSKLRGALSEGMLCSGAELQLDTSHAGIMELDGALEPGTPLVDALGLDDHMLEIDLTPNRPDCLSLIGVAREVAAFQNPAAPLTIPCISLPSDDSSIESIEDWVAIDIQDPDLCHRYTAGMLVDVSVGPSPFWLQDRLRSVGLTPINNIVDVTNFVMMETGQPLHAFDYDKVAKGRIEVKRAGGAISFTTLDGKVHTLDPDMLMICDGERPVGIAGVMGGENSEIVPETTRVLVESACFNPISVRRTAKRSGISTDASHRFERGVDPEGTLWALKRAISLMAEISSGKILNGLIDRHPVKHQPLSIDLEVSALNRRLGTAFDGATVGRLIASVGFGISHEGGDGMTVTVPSFRVDVSRPEDLSEEVARLWGYNRIDIRFPDVPVRAKGCSPLMAMRTAIQDTMVGMGFSEAVNYSFTSGSACDHLGLGEDDERRSVEGILNPISEELSVLRTSLIPGLLENMRRNNSQQTDTLRLFEIGKIFLATEKGLQPREIEMAAGLWCGAREPSVSWHSRRVVCDFYDIKGAVEELLCALGFTETSFLPADSGRYPYYQKGYGAVIGYKGEDVGSVGKMSDTVGDAFGLRQDAFLFELDLHLLLSHYDHNTMRSTDPLPKFPSLSRDLTLILDKEVEAGCVLADVMALKEKQPLIEDAYLFDLYEGEPLEAHKKSISIRIVYRSWEKTLKEKQVKKIHEYISNEIVKKHGGTLPA